MANKKNGTRYLVQLAVLTAILLVLEMTGLGIIKVGVIEMTILQIPVIIGAIVMGPAAGGILGGIFGLISFWECISGRSYFGAALFAIDPMRTLIVCLIPRILLGILTGLVFCAFSQETKKRHVYPFVLSGLTGAVSNTVLFMTALLTLFGSSDYLSSMRGGAGILSFAAAMVGVQGLIEAIVCCVLGSAVSKALYHARRN